MDCSCEIDVFYDYGDMEPIDLLSAKIVTAKNAQQCHECRRRILPGRKYEYTTYLCDGEFEIRKTCQDCLSLRRRFFPNIYIYGALIEAITNHIHDCNGEIPEDCIAALTPAARAWLCKEIERAWAVMENKKTR